MSELVALVAALALGFGLCASFIGLGYLARALFIRARRAMRRRP